MGLEAAIF